MLNRYVNVIELRNYFFIHFNRACPCCQTKSVSEERSQVQESMMEHCAILVFFLLIKFQVPEVICFAQLDSEPQCRSQFDYEYNVVQKIVALENLCEDLKSTNNELRAEIQDVKRTNEGKNDNKL